MVMPKKRSDAVRKNEICSIKVRLIFSLESSSQDLSFGNNNFTFF